MHNHLYSPNISIKVEGKYIFMKNINFIKFVYNSIRQLYCCDITDISTVPPEFHKILKHRDSFGKEKKNNCSIFDKTLSEVFLNNFHALNRS